MIQAIRGFRDVLPDEGRRWRFVEDVLRRVLCSYAYEEVQLPLLESTELFSRGVGEATDIVEKEMYSLTDGMATASPCARKVRQAARARCSSTACFSTRLSAFSIPGPCSATRDPRKADTGSFIRSVRKYSGLSDPT